MDIINLVLGKDFLSQDVYCFNADIDFLLKYTTDAQRKYLKIFGQFKVVSIELESPYFSLEKIYEFMNHKVGIFLLI